MNVILALCSIVWAIIIIVLVSQIIVTLSLRLARIFMTDIDWLVGVLREHRKSKKQKE